MTDTVDRRIVEIDVRTARAMQANVKRAADSLKGLETTIGSLKGMLGGLAAGFAGAFTVGAFIQGIRQSINMMEEMGNRAESIGVTAQALSALTYQAKQTGIGAEQLDASLVKLNDNLASLGYVSNSATQALESLGVEAGTDTTKALEQIADQFAKMPDGVRKTALAIDLFGKGGAKLIPMLNEGKAGLEAFRKEAERLGIVINDQNVAAARAFNAEMGALGAATSALFLEISKGLLPSITQLAAAMQNLKKESPGTLITLGEGLGSVLKLAAEWAARLAATLNGIAILIGGIGAAALSVAKLDFREAKTIIGIMQDELKKNAAAFEAFKKGLEAPAPVAEAKPKLAPEFDEGILQTGEDVLDFIFKTEALVAGADAAWVKYIDTLLEGESALAGILQPGKTVTQMLMEQHDRVEELTGRNALKEYLSDIEAITEAWDRGELTIDEYNEAMKRLGAVTDDTKDKTKDLGDAMKQMGEAIIAATEGWSRDAADAVLDFALGVEDSITKMVTNVLRQFARLALQKLVFDSLFQGFTTAIGGQMGAKTPTTAGGGGLVRTALGAGFDGGRMLALGAGGVVTGPTPFAFAGGMGVMGEAGPEAVMPLKRNSKGELGVEGGGVTVNVINQAGAAVSVEHGRSSNGRREIQVLIQQAVSDGFARGRFDSMMGATYGLARRGR